MLRTVTSLVFLGTTGMLFSQSSAPSLGLFEASGDVGTVLQQGSVQIDPDSKTYTVAGSGANIWAAEDDFQFVWRKVSARNATLAADLQFLGSEGDHHRKGVLMIRQSLEPDSAYVDVAVHGDGLTSLQFRDKKGGPTQEIESNVSGPKRVKIEKRQAQFSMWIGSDESTMRFSGAATSVALTGSFYVGIGVSAHDKNAIQRVAFTNLSLSSDDQDAKPNKRYSSLITINVHSTDARVSEVTPEQIEKPVWASDGVSVNYSVAGRQKTVPASLYGAHPASKTQYGAGNAGKFVSPDGTQSAYMVGIIAGNIGYWDDTSLCVRSMKDDTLRCIAKMQTGSLSEHPWSMDGTRLAYAMYQWVME